MVHHYEYSTINSHHKVLVNLQASNMDTLKSKSCVQFSNKNSSGDEIANVNFLRQHRTCRGQRIRPFNEFVISTKRLRQKRYTHTRDKVNSDSTYM